MAGDGLVCLQMGAAAASASGASHRAASARLEPPPPRLHMPFQRVYQERAL